VTYTKEIALHDRVTVDGVDISNACRSFGFTSETATVDDSGFSVTGTDETLSGATAQGFTGDIYVTKEIEALLFPIHKNRTSCWRFLAAEWSSRQHPHDLPRPLSAPHVLPLEHAR
jgi:predicted neuraminidase